MLETAVGQSVGNDGDFSGMQECGNAEIEHSSNSSNSKEDFFFNESLFVFNFFDIQSLRML